MINRGLIAGIVFLAGAFVTATAGAAELKVLGDEAMKPALDELVKGYEASSKIQVKVDYASSADVEKKVDAGEDYDLIVADKATATKLGKEGQVAIGSIKPLAKKDDKSAYDAAMSNWTAQAASVETLIAFLKTAKAAEIYKAKGLQPG